MRKNGITLGGAILVLSGVAMTAAAQETDNSQDAEKVERVTVTGSSLKRVDAETALPVTVIKSDEFISKGMTTVEEVLASLSMNQQTTTGAGNVGVENGGKSSANLRGLGDGRTLVLLDGRRLANHPYDASSADLYSIPMAAIDRIEVLRDGASHIYGTDAIAGVVNFITKRSVKGVSVTGEAVVPQQSGGKEMRFSITGGIGDLQKDGYNIFGAVDDHTQARVTAQERSFSSTGILPGNGISKTSGTTFPANFYSSAGVVGNPGFASGCQPQYSIPSTTNNTCREDYARFVDDIPESRQTNFLGKASLKIGDRGVASLEYLHAESVNSGRIAPQPETGLTMNSGNRWYPGGAGGTPVVAGLTGEPLTINWRTTEAGERKVTNLEKSDRLVASLTGDVAGWDYNTGINIARTKVTESLAGGFLNDVALQSGVASGVLNPFGLQDAAGAAYLASAQVRGDEANAVSRNSSFDVRFTRDLMSLPGGELGFSVGAEERHESSDFIMNRTLLNQVAISHASGLVSAKDDSGARSLSAVFSEINAPVRRDLEVQLAARYDRYTDFGSTFNPKIGFRYQPLKTFLLRGSANTGFRAPTVYELNGPVRDDITSAQYNDPVLCPGGVPKPGVNPLVSCNANLPTRTGGNPQLKPERAKSYSMGIVFEPAQQLNLSLDYSKIVIRDSIGDTLTEDVIVNGYNTYQNRFFYNAAGNALDYINTSSLDNGGERMTQVLDLTAQWRLPMTSLGNFDGWFNGTYVLKDTFQDINGVNQDDIGNYNGTVRWRYNNAVRWNYAPWSVTLSQRYSSGYVDQNLVAQNFLNKVSANSIWTLVATYSGFHNLTLSGGIKNLFNTNPPFSNQSPNPQTGYDPRLSDPIGRALFLRAGYTF